MGLVGGGKCQVAYLANGLVGIDSVGPKMAGGQSPHTLEHICGVGTGEKSFDRICVCLRGREVSSFLVGRA